MKCADCDKEATGHVRLDPFGKSDGWKPVCADHGMRLVCAECDKRRAQVIELEGEAMGRSQDDGKLEREIERLQAQVIEYADYREHRQMQDKLAREEVIHRGKRIAALEAKVIELQRSLADSQYDRQRWHQAFLDAKYPDIRPTRVELETTIARLRAVLAELNATVKGECPNLLDEDSGGNSRLDIKIEELLKGSPAASPTDSGLVDQTNLKDCDCAPAEAGIAPQPLPCECTTHCSHRGYPDAPLRRGYFCRERKASTASDSPPAGRDDEGAAAEKGVKDGN